MIPISGEFEYVAFKLMEYLKDAPIVDTGEWQARVGAAEGVTIELQDVVIEFPIPETVEQLQNIVKPNLPWAEDHFEERVSGRPMNPPPSNAWWPFNVAGNEGHKTGEIFSHTYPERYWPTYATADGLPSITPHPDARRGIRFAYGGLGELLETLEQRPDTRQGYLPVWFPEDLTASRQGERVPCTLGYHMMQRYGRLGIRYYMRSCDFVRHWRDDVYMTARLCQWVCSHVSHKWVPGKLWMSMSSLHAFANDRTSIRKMYDEEMNTRLNRAFA